jgi:phthiocerol/phenolphthiocerol synthesis type-I polyketide synthase E
MKEDETKTGLEIAVIGMGGRFPGAKNIGEFWENLRNGRESITFFSEEELLEEGIDPEIIKNPAFVKAKGVLDGVEYFDPYFFDFTPVEAEVMDPQTRIFFECTWQALEDSGYNPENYEGEIGLYAGNAINHYWIAKIISSQKHQLFGPFKTNLLAMHFCTRISYHLDLKGPSFTIQTACSTSLVAVHVACLSLISSECDMALAGGVSLSLPQKSGYLYKEGMIGSPDGHCRAFDAKAKGTIGGSGAGVVLLKRLDEALEDRDHIYAIVKGTAINNDGGRKVGYTAPSVIGQAEAIRSACLMAEVDPTTIGYIETHGTATELGDPVEIEALSMVYHKSKTHSIPIGSVKTNLGHLDTAAGIAGFIKTVLVLKHREIPPSLHYENPNPAIDFENLPFYVNTELQAQKESGKPFRAGVSSFGLGGTNAHAILEEAPSHPPAIYARKEKGTGTHDETKLGKSGDRQKESQLILLSAMTPTALEQMTENLGEYFEKNRKKRLHLSDVAYTLQTGRKVHQYRKVMPCTSIEEALEIIKKPTNRIKRYVQQGEKPSVYFLFSGQGSQYINMGLGLYRKEPVFRDAMNQCYEVAENINGKNLKKILYPEAEEKIQEVYTTEIALLFTFIFEYALAKLCIAWGIIPTAMIGYSFGEYTAACIAGVVSMEDTLKIITTRGKMMEQTPKGAMLSVPLPEKELIPLLKGTDEISIAIDNGSSCVLSGPEQAIEEFEKGMREKRLLCAPINVPHAVHSPLMETIREGFEREMGKITLKRPEIPYVSNVTGTWITIEEAVEPRYWGQHLCHKVRFSEGIHTLKNEGNAVFIEIGPGRVLSNIVRQHLNPGTKSVKEEQNRKTSHQVVNIVKHQQEKITDNKYLLKRLGELWLYGVPIDWRAYYGQEKPSRISLPTYPFARRRCWIDTVISEGIPQSFQMKKSEDESTHEREEYPGYSFKDTLEEEDFQGPGDELEQTIASLWQEFLGLDRISIHTNFFDINGDSLTATQLITRLQQVYPVEISLKRFFEQPTILNLSEMIRERLVQKIKELSDEELETLANK